jgi:hypothetical protein
MLFSFEISLFLDVNLRMGLMISLAIGDYLKSLVSIIRELLFKTNLCYSFSWFKAISSMFNFGRIFLLSNDFLLLQKPGETTLVLSNLEILLDFIWSKLMPKFFSNSFNSLGFKETVLESMDDFLFSSSLGLLYFFIDMVFLVLLGDGFKTGSRSQIMRPCVT